MTDADEVVTAMARLDALVQCTDEPGRISRLAFSSALRDANDLVLGWMREAGMAARIDAAGNVVGRYAADRPDAPAVMIGSHLDSVRDAGRFDGPLGVTAGIAVVERLNREGRRLPYAIEIVGFADEEGVRFGGMILGSAALAGTLPAGWMERHDEAGVSAADAVRAFGPDPGAVAQACRAADPPLAYLELHIEQGPVLESLGIPLGCVTGIAGATRLMVTVEGMAGHAGTVPMGLRQDALAATADCILAVERLCAGDEAVGTVGFLHVEPNASNVIAGRVQFSVDLRTLRDPLRASLIEALRQTFQGIAARRALSIHWEVMSETAATPCSPPLMKAVETAIAATIGKPAPRLASGAGHDAIAMSAITPIGMIFVRCAGGISHNPAEYASPSDIEVGIEALYRCCVSLDAGPRG